MGGLIRGSCLEGERFRPGRGKEGQGGTCGVWTLSNLWVTFGMCLPPLAWTSLFYEKIGLCNAWSTSSSAFLGLWGSEVS